MGPAPPGITLYLFTLFFLFVQSMFGRNQCETQKNERKGTPRRGGRARAAALRTLVHLRMHF